MKVLKKGRKQQGWTTKQTCTGKGNGNGGCGAELLVEIDDIFRTENHSYDGSSDYFHTFECADCRVLTDIEGCPVSAASLPSRKEWLHGKQYTKMQEEARERERQDLSK